MVSLLLANVKNTLTDAFQFEKVLRLFPWPTQTSIMRKRFHNDAVVALFSQVLQRFTLRYLSGRGDIEVKFGKYGKPFADGLKFSMSNEKGWCAMAVGDDNSDLGLDLNLVTREELILEVLHPLEKEYIENEKLDTRDQFQWLWAMKEAYGKYTGKGINYDLSSVRFVLPLEEVKFEVVPSDKLDKGPFKRRDVQWYRTWLEIKGVRSELEVLITKVDGLVCCLVGESLGIPQLFMVEVDEMLPEDSPFSRA